MTEAYIQAGERKAIEEIEQIPGIANMPREVKIEYRGEEFAVKVNSYNEEIALRFAAVVQGLAVEQHILAPLWCEDCCYRKN